MVRRLPKSANCEPPPSWRRMRNSAQCNQIQRPFFAILSADCPPSHDKTVNASSKAPPPVFASLPHTVDLVEEFRLMSFRIPLSTEPRKPAASHRFTKNAQASKLLSNTCLGPIDAASTTGSDESLQSKQRKATRLASGTLATAITHCGRHELEWSERFKHAPFGNGVQGVSCWSTMSRRVGSNRQGRKVLQDTKMGLFGFVHSANLPVDVTNRQIKLRIVRGIQIRNDECGV